MPGVEGTRYHFPCKAQKGDTGPMNRSRPIRHFLHTALLLVVLSGAGHIHNHVCLDGQEAEALVHFENLGGHPDHHEDDAAHSDIENELIPQMLLTKTPDQDGQLFVAAVLLVLTETLPAQRPHYVVVADGVVLRQPADLTPPSQGPPSSSV